MPEVEPDVIAGKPAAQNAGEPSGQPPAIDPNEKLTKLEGSYKELQAEFTKRNQAAAEERRQWEAEREAASEARRRLQELEQDPDYLELRLRKTRGVDPLEGVDLSTISPTQYVPILAERHLGSKFERLEKSFNERVERLEQSLRLGGVREEMRQAAAAHPDFDEHLESIGKITDRYPDLAIEDAYKLSKAAITEQQAAAANKQAEQAKLAAAKAKATAVPPNSRGTQPGVVAKPKGRVTFADAVRMHRAEAGQT